MRMRMKWAAAAASVMALAAGACGSSGEACATLSPEGFEAAIAGLDAGSRTSMNAVRMTAYLEGGVNVSMSGADRIAYRTETPGALEVEYQGSFLYISLEPGETRLRLRGDGIDCRHFAP